MNHLDNTHGPREAISDWRTALRYLQDGNRRYVENRMIDRREYIHDRLILTDMQKPFAAIVTCSDSRVPPEIFFDQKLGDIFVVRVAGNIADTATLGTIEFAVEFVKVPLIAVVAHSDCRAVIGAFNNGEYSGNLRVVMDNIRPAVKDCKNADDAIHANLDYVANRISNNDVIKSAGAMVLGAYYDIGTGVVSFAG